MAAPDLRRIEDKGGSHLRKQDTKEVRIPALESSMPGKSSISSRRWVRTVGGGGCESGPYLHYSGLERLKSTTY